MAEITRSILCVDDEPNVVAALRRQFRRRYDVTTACSGRAGLELLERHGPFAVVVADYSMPEMNGVEFLREVKRVAPDTVTVMLTGVTKLDVAVSALHEGHVYRFLTKPWDAGELIKTLNECLEQYSRTMTQRLTYNAYEDSQEEIIRAARIDRLMGICNRGTFDDYHADLHGKLADTSERYALIMADVDNFKAFNDHYGHTDGDKVLRAVAHAMKNALRDRDFIARYGGEEIVVICEAVDIQTAERIAERLRSAVLRLDITHDHNAGHERVTMSLGVAVHDAGRRESSEDVLVRADTALYEAKHTGRNKALLAKPAVLASDDGEAMAGAGRKAESTRVQ